MGMRLLLASLALLAAPVAQACSVVSTYRVPTTLELAERADTIVLGTIVGAAAGEDITNSQLRVRPDLLIKGTALPEEVSLWGHLVEPPILVTPSDPRELRQPNPDALNGGCTRYLFRPKTRLLLFLERKEGKLVATGYPFARVYEDVTSDDALWVKAVRLYAEIARLPVGDRNAAMAARRDALRGGDADAQALAEDLDRELAWRR